MSDGALVATDAITPGDGPDCLLARIQYDSLIGDGVSLIIPISPLLCMYPAQDHLDTTVVLEKTFIARVEHYKTLGSTNDRAKQCAAEGGYPLPLLIVADQQTAGRGRGSNRWWTGRGSLAFSLLVDAEALGIGRAGFPLVSLASAVAVAEAVSPLLTSHTVGLRWPNDVFVAERKLAGVLVEIPSPRFHVIGIGVNTNNALEDAPPELRRTATTILELNGSQVDQTAVLVRLLGRLAETLRQAASAPHEIAERADGLCLQRGQTLTISSGRRSTTGRCVGIAADGGLVLEAPGGRQVFYAGVLR